MLRSKTQSRPRCARPRLNVEQLESRATPATLVNPFVVTYQDVDGDNVTVRASRPLFAGTANFILKFNVGSVDGSNDLKQQLQSVNLTTLQLGNGVGVSVTATPSPIHGGDGHVNVGEVRSTNNDLGSIAIDGDLGHIRAGDKDFKTTSLANLIVQSLGRLGLTTQDAATATLTSDIAGPMGKLTVKSDIVGASFNVTGGPIGAVFVGGSVQGVGALANGQITASGNIGSVTIRGDLVGAGGVKSGSVSTSGRLGPVMIGGDVIGGAGGYSGYLRAALDMGPVSVGGSIRGGVGTGSGSILAKTLANVTVHGSVLGGVGSSSGNIESTGNMGAVVIGGNVGGSADPAAGTGSGLIKSGGKILGMVAGVPVGFRVGGSLVGGAQSISGVIQAAQGIGPSRVGGDLVGGPSSGNAGQVLAGGRLDALTIGGSLIAGDGSYSGYIKAGRIGSVRVGGNLAGGGNGSSSAMIQALLGEIGTLTIGGSIATGGNPDSGSIQAAGPIGTMLVKGNLIGTAAAPVRITMGGKHAIGNNVVLGSLTVRGRVEHADILAGFDGMIAKNADAQIGIVKVGGDWIASNLVAGAIDGGNGFGNTLDAKMAGAGVMDDPLFRSAISALTIGGQVLGTLGGADHFGFVAERLGVLNIGGSPIALHAGLSNDAFNLGPMGDVSVREI